MTTASLMLGLAAWLIASAFVLAIAYLIHRRVRTDRPALNAIGFLGLSVLLVTFFLLAVGLAGGLRASNLAGISGLGLAALIGLPGTRRELGRARVDAEGFATHLRRWWRSLPTWLQWLTALALLVSALRFAFLIWALPPFVWDSLTYHLTNVAHWVQTGRIELFETSMERIYTPANYEVLAAWFAVFLHHDAFIEAAGLPAYVMAVLAVYAASRSLGASRPSSWMAGMAYGSMPALLIAVTGTKNDPHMAGYYLALLAFGLDFALREASGRIRVRQATVAALLLLLAVGTKAYIAHILPGLVLIALVAGWPKRGAGQTLGEVRSGWQALWAARRGQRALLLGLLAVGLFVGGYWNVRNWVLTGNPFYPYGVKVEGAQVAEGPHNDIFLNLDRAQENFASLADKFGDHRAPIRPDLVGVTGWGWFAYGLGMPLTLWALFVRPRSRVLTGGFALSLFLIFLSIRPSPWNLRYVLWFPALFALPFANWMDRQTDSRHIVRVAFIVLFVFTLGMNFSTTLNYNKVAPEEFGQLLRVPLWQRGSAVYGLNTPENYSDVVRYVPPDETLGYNVHGNGFIYPLYRPDFSQDLEFIRLSPDTPCAEIAARMRHKGTRYLFVAPEHTDDLKIARLGECAIAGEHLLERGRDLYVLPD